MNDFSAAEVLIRQFKGDHYLHGLDVLGKSGLQVSGLGSKALFVRDHFPGSESYAEIILASLESNGVEELRQVKGAEPNAPRPDVFRITEEIKTDRPELLVSFGGGSTTDAVKAANVLATLTGEIDDFFGTGLVTKALQAQDKHLIPHLAIQAAASSGAHLTKYSNITDVTLSTSGVTTGQKKLIVDEAIVPFKAVFDYKTTLGAPVSLTVDGALDGISHALEVLYSVTGKPAYDQVLPVSLECIRLVVEYLPKALAAPRDITARQALGLATDLGGYAIMLGGTNGAHLTSFSLVDILSHGRACGMMNPYYTVFFAPAVEVPLRMVAAIYQHLGYMPEDPVGINGRALGQATARAMIAFEKSIGFPVTLEEVPGFNDKFIERALDAAKDPQLRMKLENMPVPLTAEMVDEYMEPILQAAKTGNLDLIKNQA